MRHLFRGLDGVYCRIPVCFVVQSSSGTGRADGPMDFAVRDEPAWIPSREEAPPFDSRRGGVYCDEHAKMREPTADPDQRPTVSPPTSE